MKNDKQNEYKGRWVETITLGMPCKAEETPSEDFNLINLLRGTWVSRAEGWNLIALPASPKDLKDPPTLTPPLKPFRLLMNQYGETLKFNVSDAKVPNRGVTANCAGGKTSEDRDEPDQTINAIAYEQTVVQRAFEDFPASISGKHAKNGEPIHHEPGFFLQFENHVLKGRSPDVGDDKDVKELKIARMGSIPHGNSVLAMGFVSHERDSPNQKGDNAFPERLMAGNAADKCRTRDTTRDDVLQDSYLAPYQHFSKGSPFFGCVDPSKKINKAGKPFPGFSPDEFNAILEHERANLDIEKITVLNFDTKFHFDGVNPQCDANIDNPKFDACGKPISGIPISNVPFVQREANVTEMHAKFWIIELKKTDLCDNHLEPEFVMQYSQTVYLEFFDSPVETGRRIRWPHVSINTLRKVPA